MKKQWCICLAVFSLLVGSMGCIFSEREIPVDKTSIVISASEEPTESPARGGVEVASLDLSKVWAPSNLQSYRAEYHMEISFGDDKEESNLTTTMTLEVTADPSAQHVTITYEGDMLPEEMPVMETEMYIFDGIAYLRSNIFDEWTAFEGELVDLMGDTLLNPQDYVDLPEKAERNVTPETINGISTWHYTFDENDVENPVVEYEEVSTETWIAVDGGFIVKLESFVKGADLSEDLDENLFAGLIESSRVHTTYEMKDVNDEFTIILPPEAAEAEISDIFSTFDTEWTREDVPFPEEAEVEYSFEDSISLQIPWTVQQTKDYMLTQLQANGWVLQMEHLNSQDYYLGDFKNADDFLSLSIEKDILEPEQTSIYVETKKIVPWSRSDVPLPQDALIEQSFEGEVQALTFLTVQEATDFMVTQMETNGWILDMELMRDESDYIGTFTKGGETLSLIIKSAFDEQSRTRIQITIE